MSALYFQLQDEKNTVYLDLSFSISPGSLYSTNTLHFQVSHDQNTPGLNLYECTCKECGLQKRKKKSNFLITGSLFAALLKFMRCIEKVKPLPRMKNNVRGEKSRKWADIHILFFIKSKGNTNFDKLTFGAQGDIQSGSRSAVLLQEHRWEVHFRAGRRGIKKLQLKFSLELFPPSDLVFFYILYIFLTVRRIKCSVASRASLQLLSLRS